MKKIFIIIFGIAMLQSVISQPVDPVKPIVKSGTAGNPGEFKNAITFITVSSGTWTVPEWVTRIQVEAWGGGGAGRGNGLLRIF